MYDDEGKKKYNILYTTSFSHMAGGGQWSLYHLIKHLDEVFHPIVMCPAEGELAERMREVGAEVMPFWVGRMRHFNPFVVWRLISIFKKRGIDIIHTDSTTETFYAGIAARLTGIPLIWHIRVSEGEWFWDRVLSSLSTRLILVAKALEARFKWLKGKSRMVVIYNGIDLADFDKGCIGRVSIRDEYGIPDDTTLVICIGRIEEKKGQGYLVEALRGIKGVILLLVGDGDKGYLERLRKIADDMGISNRIIYTGPRGDIPVLLKGVDIVVFPSLTEGFSRVILEAMAGGKAVVATNVGGNPEAIIDGITGYIVPVRDAMVLAERINELINNREKLEQMGRAGRKRVEELFAIERHVESVERLYREILGR